ncbi:MAG: hypothetical protein LIP12_00760 [Clostridiales bacterium]|nr:hypothetical protein [Clostridiales bacterium]
MNENETTKMAIEMVESLTIMSDEDFVEMKAQIMEDAERLPRVKEFMEIVFRTAERQRRKEESL